MKKKLIVSILCICTACMLFAHTPLVLVEDNYDGTLFIECGFSNNASAAGLTVLIVEDAPYNGPSKTWEGKKILWIGTLDKTGCISIVKPAAAKYTVLFDAGPGHIGKAKGPALAPDEIEQREKAFASLAPVIGKWEKQLRGTD